MAITFSDDEIAALVHERKPLPDNWRTRTRLRPKPGHREAQLILEGDAGNEFHVILRLNSNNLLDFSVILAVRVPAIKPDLSTEAPQREEPRAQEPH